MNDGRPAYLNVAYCVHDDTMVNQQLEKSQERCVLGVSANADMLH